MLDRQKGSIFFECDNCGDHIDMETNNFDKALARFKEEGWRSHHDEKGNWEHYCPECPMKKSILR